MNICAEDVSVHMFLYACVCTCGYKQGEGDNDFQKRNLDVREQEVVDTYGKEENKRRQMTRIMATNFKITD